MSDETLRELLEVQAYFRLPSVVLVEKDLHVVSAIAAIAGIDASPFKLVFGGGTALARAHKLVRRMSEDVDFKIVPTPSAPTGRSAIRRDIGRLRERVLAALQAAGFAFDPANESLSRSLNENRYTVYQLPYTPIAGTSQRLRPTIQIELTYAPMRRSPVVLSVASFVTEATKRPSEIPAISCVGVDETAAEKLVSLTRRTAMDLAGASRDPDPALVRHIYDLHMMRQHLDQTDVNVLARDIAVADAQEFRNQHPAYEADIASETRKALDALRTASMHRERYDHFMADMVYGEKVEFPEAMATVTALASSLVRDAGSR